MRRRGGAGRCGAGADVTAGVEAEAERPCGMSDASGGECASLDELGLGVSFVCAEPVVCCNCVWIWPLTDCEVSEGRVVGVGGPEGKGVVAVVTSPVLLVLV